MNESKREKLSFDLNGKRECDGWDYILKSMNWLKHDMLAKIVRSKIIVYRALDANAFDVKL